MPPLMLCSNGPSWRCLNLTTSESPNRSGQSGCILEVSSRRRSRMGEEQSGSAGSCSGRIRRDVLLQPPIPLMRFWLTKCRRLWLSLRRIPSMKLASFTRLCCHSERTMLTLSRRQSERWTATGFSRWGINGWRFRRCRDCSWRSFRE
jgi:hypothetical protein